jgi:hypothetical protein
LADWKNIGHFTPPIADGEPYQKRITCVVLCKADGNTRHVTSRFPDFFLKPIAKKELKEQKYQ